MPNTSTEGFPCLTLLSWTEQQQEVFTQVPEMQEFAFFPSALISEIQINVGSSERPRAYGYVCIRRLALYWTRPPSLESGVGTIWTQFLRDWEMSHLHVLHQLMSPIQTLTGCQICLLASQVATSTRVNSNQTSPPTNPR